MINRTLKMPLNERNILQGGSDTPVSVATISEPERSHHQELAANIRQPTNQATNHALTH